MRRAFKIFATLLFPVLLILLAGAWTMKVALDAELQIDDDTVFVLPPGTGYSAMVNQLQKQDLVDGDTALKLYGRLLPSVAQIRAGEYRLLPGMTVRRVLTMMRQGEVVRHQLTLVEGWSLRQVLAYLANQPLLSPQSLPGDDNLWALLGVDEPLASSPEGLFFPDTYDYHRGDNPADILKRAYSKMRQVLEQEWQGRSVGLPYKTPYEALIMASVIEKETGLASEREVIAGVFVRRLAAGMRLQTDPTVIFGLGEEYAGNLRLSHLRDQDNSYNTYRHHGLPPTPIALAGREAIHAAMHPAAGDALFFVARGDGSHHFSATLKEHEAAVQKYQLQQRRSDYRSAPAKGEK